MKKKILFIGLVTFIGSNIYAQDIILDPNMLIPADTGYYIEGVYKDKNNDGVAEWYNGCDDEYGDLNHNEDGIQQSFTYNKSMIMPTCWPKLAVIDHSLANINHPEGYIQLTKSIYPNTDSALLGYIITPQIFNLVSLTMETSPDVSASDARHIMWWIEYSKDNGNSWEETYLEDETLSKLGDEHFYDGSVLFEFQEMIDASKVSPIVLRIMSKPKSDNYQSQRLKIHYIKIVADSSSSINRVDNPKFSMAPGIYTAPFDLSVSTDTINTQIYYTTDESTPSKYNGTLYSNPIPVIDTTIVKAIAYKDGLTESVVVSADYYIRHEACIYIDTIWVNDTIVVFDTVTIYDTIKMYISVEDTLNIFVANTSVTSNYLNEIMVFPNPTDGILWIDCGEYLNMGNYELTLINSVSQVIWNSTISQQAYVINLFDKGKGLFFLKINDPEGNILAIRKIVVK